MFSAALFLNSNVNENKKSSSSAALVTFQVIIILDSTDMDNNSSSHMHTPLPHTQQITLYVVPPVCKVICKLGKEKFW